MANNRQRIQLIQETTPGLRSVVNSRGQIQGNPYNPKKQYKPNNVINTVGKFLLPSTARAINQAYQEGKQAVETGRMITAGATGNNKAYRAAVQRSNKDYSGFKKSGGLFDLGTLTSSDEARRGDLKTGLKKIGGGTIGSAAEIVPVGLGATAGVKVGERALPVIAKTVAKEVGLNAGIGGVGSVGSQLADKGKVDWREAGIAAGVGGAVGGAAAAAGSIARRVLPGSGKKLAQKGFDKNTINLLTQENNPEVVHAILSHKLGRTGEDVINAAKAIAESGDAKMVAKIVGDVPIRVGEGAIATKAAVETLDHAVAKSKSKQLAEEVAQAEGDRRPFDVQPNDTPQAPDTLQSPDTPQTPDTPQVQTPDGKPPKGPTPDDLVSVTDPKKAKKIIKKLLPGASRADRELLSQAIARSDDPKLIRELIDNTPQKAPTPDIPVLPDPPATATPAKAADVAQAAKVADNAEVSQNLSGSANPTAADVTNQPARTKSFEKARETVIKNLDDVQKLAEDNAKSVTKQKGQRIAKGGSVAEGKNGLNRRKALLGSLKGKYNQKGWQGIAAKMSPENAQKYLNTLLTSTLKEHNITDRFEEINLGTALDHMVRGGHMTDGEHQIIARYFGSDVAQKLKQEVDAAATFGDKVTSVLGQAAATPKTLMTTADLSATIRQLGPLGTRHPQEWAEVVKDSPKLVNPKFFDKKMAEIRDAKDATGEAVFDTFNKYGLDLNAAKGGHEEQYTAHYLEGKTSKKLGVGHVVAASDRTYSGSATMLRAKVATKLADSYGGVKAMEEALGDKGMRDMMRVINTFSGRGSGSKYNNVGRVFEKDLLPGLSHTLFSARLWKSRIDMLNPVFYATLAPDARKLAIQNGASFMSTVGVVLGAAAAAGKAAGVDVHVENDPRSSDFGKIRWGNTRYDIMGGLQQNIVLAAREATGQKKNSDGSVTSFGNGLRFGEDGKPISIGKGDPTYGGINRISVLGDMVENKSDPVLSTTAQILRQKDKGGNPVNVKTELGSLFVPLGISDTYGAAQDAAGNVDGSATPAQAVKNLKDPKNVGAGLVKSFVPGFFGVGTQTYNAGNGSASVENTSKQTGQFSAQTIKAKEDKRTADIKKKKDEFTKKLNPDQQLLIKKSEGALGDMLDRGEINQGQYNWAVKNKGQLDTLSGKSTISADDRKKVNAMDTPAAKEFTRKFYSMTEDQRKDWLRSSTPSAESQKLVDELNNNPNNPKEFPKLAPNNDTAIQYINLKTALAKKGATDVDKRNAVKAFWVGAYKKQTDSVTQDLYAEGSSKDAKALLADGTYSKDQISKAVALDNLLVKLGLAGQKFNNKFRRAYGYADAPDEGSGRSGYKGSGSGSGKKAKEQRAYLSDYLIKTTKVSDKVFAPISRSSSVQLSGAKLPAKVGQKISINL